MRQNRIPKGHPSTFSPSQTNIATFCSQRTLSIIMTNTLMIIMRPYSSQPMPPNSYTPFEKSDLILRMGSSTNLKPTYTSLTSQTSWSLIPCPTHSSSTLQKSGIPNHVIFAANSDVLNHVSTFLCQDNCMHQTTWPNSTNHV